jgi:hypothetical protein
MAHMQGASDIRGGDDNAVRWFAVVKSRMKVALTLPFGVPPFLNIVRLVGFGEGAINRHRFILIELFANAGEIKNGDFAIPILLLTGQ